MFSENKKIYISNWLLLITFFVGAMIVVGGLTRLTDSGLSITKWDLFTGILPPITKNDWNNFFYLYQQIPEFKLENSNMTLNQFKIIFWWEYAHRLLGRIIGLLYLIPILYFTYKKFIDKKSLISLYTILFLILIQGIVGWYMVKSGLTERTDVSHFRLSIHLVLAFIILILCFWNYLKFKEINLIKQKKLPYNLALILLLFILIQIGIGGFVSGLDAGKIYQTWPLMNDYFFPDDSNINDFISLKLFSNPSLLQFIHRNVAYLIILLFIIVSLIIFKKQFSKLKKPLLYVSIFLFFQIMLGVLTLKSDVHIIFASLHQVCSIFLVGSSVYLLFKSSYTN
tara:strand:+ start:9697 stop:10716 length:1020 start_codon:yes stop_codon:yes gene_type:complete